jgi:hypothetical protein
VPDAGAVDSRPDTVAAALHDHADHAGPANPVIDNFSPGVPSDIVFG